MTKVAKTRISAMLTVAIVLFRFVTGLHAEEPHFLVMKSNGGITDVYFYGPAEWLSSSGERLSRFENLETITLACGRIGAPEMKYLATIRSLKRIATMDTPEDSVSFEPGALNELRTMTWLETLEIYQNDLPEEEWEFLSELKSLQELHLDCFRGLRFVDGNRLRYLNLYRNTYHTDMVSLLSYAATLPQLSHLGMYSRGHKIEPLSDISLNAIEKAPMLTSLRLEGVSESGIVTIGRLRNLEHLSLTEVSPKSDIGLLRSLINLRELFLDVESLKASDLTFVGELQKLELLSLRCLRQPSDAILNIPFGKLNKLKKIYLWTTPLDRSLATSLQKLPEVQEVWVQSIGDEAKDAVDALRQKNIKVRSANW